MVMSLFLYRVLPWCCLCFSIELVLSVFLYRVLTWCCLCLDALCGHNRVWSGDASYLPSLLLISLTNWRLPTNTVLPQKQRRDTFQLKENLTSSFPSDILYFLSIMKTSSRRSWCQERQLLNSFKNKTCLKVNFQNWMTVEKQRHDTITLKTISEEALPR